MNANVFRILCNILPFTCLSFKSLKRTTLNLAARESDQYLKKILFSDGKLLTNMQQSTYQQIFMKAVSSIWTKRFYFNTKLGICVPFLKTNNLQTQFPSPFLVQICCYYLFFLLSIVLQRCALLSICFILWISRSRSERDPLGMDLSFRNGTWGETKLLHTLTFWSVLSLCCVLV